MVEAKCQSLVNNWLGEAGEIESCEVEPGLREVVMKVAMASCPQHQTLDSLLKLLDVPQERNRVLHSLGYSKNKDVLVRVLEFSIDEITIGFQGHHARLKLRCGKFKRAGEGCQVCSHTHSTHLLLEPCKW